MTKLEALKAIYSHKLTDHVARFIANVSGSNVKPFLTPYARNTSGWEIAYLSLSGDRLATLTDDKLEVSARIARKAAA